MSKYGVYINHRDFTLCGLLTCAGTVTGLHDRARQWNSQEDATEYISANGLENSVSVPEHGVTAYVCELRLPLPTVNARS